VQPFVWFGVATLVDNVKTLRLSGLTNCDVFVQGVTHDGASQRAVADISNLFFELFARATPRLLLRPRNAPRILRAQRHCMGAVAVPGVAFHRLTIAKKFFENFLN
jgi:hypothetical protein